MLLLTCLYAKISTVFVQLPWSVPHFFTWSKVHQSSGDDEHQSTVCYRCSNAFWLTPWYQDLWVSPCHYLFTEARLWSCFVVGEGLLSRTSVYIESLYIEELMLMFYQKPKPDQSLCQELFFLSCTVSGMHVRVSRDGSPDTHTHSSCEGSSILVVNRWWSCDWGGMAVTVDPWLYMYILNPLNKRAYFVCRLNV